METIEFADPAEIARKHPTDRRFLPVLTHGQSPVPGRGVWASDVTLMDGRRCASVFIGQGRAVRISIDGTYIGDDTAEEVRSRVENGAWVPESIYYAAERQHDMNG